jgi:hypothetical protein
MYRTVRFFYGIGVAVFWAVCAAAAVAVHRPVVVAVLAVVAVLDAGAMWLAFRDARAGIRRNTVGGLDRPDVGL